MRENSGNRNNSGIPNNSGIQNFSSTVNGPQAAGPFARADQLVDESTAMPAAWPSPDAAALAEAVEALRAELASLRAQHPHVVSDVDAATAEIALRDVKDIAARQEPNRHALHQRVRTIAAALRDATTLTTALAVLETTVRKLVGLP